MAVRTIDLRNQGDLAAAPITLPRPEIDIDAALGAVRPIMAQVKADGAQALYALSEKFDGVKPPSLRVPKSAIDKAVEELDEDVRCALQVAIGNAMEAHRAQLPVPKTVEILPGGKIIQRWRPIARVGLYVPGGLAVYPSSVVMNAVPALVAGVDSMVVASPPQKGNGGLPHPTVLAACGLLGVKEVIAVGGAQAIAAMTYGFKDTEAEKPYYCAPVDKVTGPGNIYVAAAKRVAQETCGIDAEAGPSEIAVLADEDADPRLVAKDLISQAEHDPAAAAVLVTDSPALADAVKTELARLAPRAKHAKRVTQALNGPQSAVVLTDDLDAAIAVVNRYAPEHLQIMTKHALGVAERITAAGAIFVGEFSPVPLGDYVAGSNHVLPTGGTARFASGLNVMAFLKSTQIIDYTKDALAQVTPALVALANAEDLPAHGESALARFEEDLGGACDPAEDDGTVAEGREGQGGVRLPVRSELQDVEPYGAPVLDVPVRLNVNENPFEPAEEVVDSITEAVRDVATGLNRYSDRDAWELREQLSSYLQYEAGVNVKPSQIWAANGSNEIMLQLLQAFGGPGRLAMAQWPTYSMYPEYARDTNTEFLLVGEKGAQKARKKPPRFKPGKLIRAMKVHRPSVVFLASPNNPTGSPVPLADIEDILKAARTTGPSGSNGGFGSTSSIVIVDEAYAEFRDPGMHSALEFVDRYPNLVVTRTMSKAFAAAGLRLGYLVANPKIVDEVQKVRLPYHLSLLTQAAAIATLKHADLQLEQVGLLREEREALSEWLEGHGLQVAPSASNFLMFGRLENPTGVWEKLVEKGVLVREVGPVGYLRVTVGTPEENKKFKEALEEVLRW